MESLSAAEWMERLAALHRRAAAVIALERAMVEYRAAGGGLALPVVCAECPAARGGRKAKGDGGKGKKAA